MFERRGVAPPLILTHNRDVAGTRKDMGRKLLTKHQASRRDLLLTTLMAALPFVVAGAAPVHSIRNRRSSHRRMSCRGKVSNHFPRRVLICAGSLATRPRQASTTRLCVGI